MLTLNKSKMDAPKTVFAYNPNGSLRRSWKASLVSQDDFMITLFGVFETRVDHPLLGIIPAGTGSFEFYPLGNWFNIFCFLTPNKGLRNFYCNLASPPVINENGFSFVDYEIDVLVTADKKVSLIDLQDYVIQDEQGRYDLSTKEILSSQLLTLLHNIKNQEFPFDFTKHLSPYLEMLRDD